MSVMRAAAKAKAKANPHSAPTMWVPPDNPPPKRRNIMTSHSQGTLPPRGGWIVARMCCTEPDLVFAMTDIKPDSLADACIGLFARNALTTYTFATLSPYNKIVRDELGQFLNQWLVIPSWRTIVATGTARASARTNGG